VQNPERGHEVDVEHGLELLVRHLFGSSSPSIVGIVDDDVEPDAKTALRDPTYIVEV
jgi:hypothetical protein